MTTGGPGESLGSRYVLVEQIGAGAMGTVWRARQRDTGETLAVKLLRGGADQDLVLRFVQERQVMGALRHPNVVAVRDFVIEGERLALVMDFVEGGDLRELLQERGTLQPRAAARLMAQAAAALAAAHAAGVVHRDVKPANIMIDRAGQVRLTDFGVARMMHAPGQTQTSSIIGTPAYLAPEVAAGDRATPAVDVYALGLILYELLAGRPPFVGDHPMALLRQHAAHRPRRLPGMPDALWPLIEACTAKDPAVRPTADTVARALSSMAPVLGDLPALPPVPGAEPPAATSEPVPGPLQGAPGVPGTPGAPGTPGVPPQPAMLPQTPAIPPTPGMRNYPHYPGEGTLPGTKTPVAGRPFLLIGAGAVAAVLALIVVAAVAWRTVGTTTVAATTSPGPDTEVAAPDLTPDITPDLVPETTPSPSPPARTKTAVAKPRPTRGSVSMTPTPRRTTSKPTPSKTPAKRTRTPRPTPTRTTAAPPSEDPAPQWRCRDWFTVTRGVEMSPCIAQADGAFQVMGRIRGSASIRSDIRVQLYDTDADTGLGQPFVCAGVAPAADGAVVTCGPRTATALRTGAKLDVRQSWRKAGAPSFSGGVESPWVLW